MVFIGFRGNSKNSFYQQPRRTDMPRQRGRGDRGTKANDRILRKPGIFRKSRRRESFAKRINL